MHTVLEHYLAKLPEFIKQPEKWNSLVINKRKPYTHRAWYQDGDYRICLHRFETCDEAEAFLHPHAWPMACKIVQGSYNMRMGMSKDNIQEPDFCTRLQLSEGSSYTMVHPLAWHSVEPITECYTVMVNGLPWDESIRHTKVRTTKGKDLDSMTERELKQHLSDFAWILFSDTVLVDT